MRVVGNIASDSEVVATASGAITAGKPVVVNADGTVTQVSEVSQSASVGSAVVLADTMGSNEGSISFDTANNRIIIAYPDGSGGAYGKVVVGTVSGTSISFGTPQVFVSAGTSQMTSAFDTNAGKVAIMYRQGSTSRAIVGTVDSSDNSISFGSSMEWNSTYSNYQYATFDSTNNKILMVFSDYTSGTNGMGIVGTISGTDITFSSKATFYSGTLFNQTIQFDPSTGKSLITYRKSSDNKPYVRVADASSGSFTYGTEVNVNTTSVGGFSSVYHADEQKMVIFYGSVSGIYYHLDAKVATISGTNVTLGSAVSIDTGNNGDSRAIYDPDAKKIAVVFRDDSATSLELKLCTLSGSTLALSGYTDSGEGTVLDSDDAYYFDVVYDTNANTGVVSYYDNGNSGYGTAVAFQNAFTSSPITSENFIGFAKDNVADGAVATIQTANSIARDNIQAPTTSDTVGTAVVFESGSTFTYSGSVYDSNAERIVIFYRDVDDSNYGKGIVGTVSGNSVTFGTAVTFISEAVSGIRAVFDSNSNKVVVFYKNGADSEGRAHVGTVDPSDNSISFGSEATFNAGNSYAIGAAFDSTNNKIVVCFRDFGDSSKGKAIVGTVSGTSISFGSEVEFDDSYTNYHSTVFDPDTGKIVNFYQDQGNSSYGTAIVGTVSGTSISFGTPVVFNSGGTTHYIEATYDTTANKMIVAFSKNHDSNHGAAIVGTVSGTSISFGTATEFAAASSLYTKPVYVSDLDKTVIGYQDAGDSNKGTYIVGTVSGTDISFNSEAVYSANDTSFNDTLYDPTAKKVIFSYRDGSNSNTGTVTVLDLAGGDADLTIGQQYFVQTDGTLSTSADSPSVIAGTAISGTDLIVKG